MVSRLAEFTVPVGGDMRPVEPFPARGNHGVADAQLPFGAAQQLDEALLPFVYEVVVAPPARVAEVALSTEPETDRLPQCAARDDGRDGSAGLGLHRGDATGLSDRARIGPYASPAELVCHGGMTQPPEVRDARLAEQRI